jgi:hypothetical protein
MTVKPSLPDGGPAFPRAGCEWTEDHGDGAWGYDGMTLRDWFAGQALYGLLSNIDNDSDSDYPDGCSADSTCEEIRVGWAKLAFAYADAMLAERSKGS